MRNKCNDYKVLDAKAYLARRKFEYAVSALSLLGVFFPLLAAFLIQAPPDWPWRLRAVFAFALGAVAFALISMTAQRFNVASGLRQTFLGPVAGKWRKRIWTFFAGMAGLAILSGSSWLAYTFIVPETLEGRVQNVELVAIVGAILVLILTDFVSGGVTRRLLARVLNFVGCPIDPAPLRQQWYEQRGKAEALRRSIFTTLLNSGDVKSPQLLSQKLEYFRRYQIDVQQSYYDEKSQQNRDGAKWADGARMLAFVAACIMLVVLGMTWFAGNSEQGSATSFIEGPSAAIIGGMIEGWDSVFIVITLLALGTYAVLQLRTLALRERVNHKRYGNTLGQLRLCTSPATGQANADLQYPLSRARVAAAGGDLAGVRRLFNDVNQLLATEVGDWNHATSYTIEPAGDPPRVRLISSEVLAAHEDFERIVLHLEDFGLAVRGARKIAFVSAKQHHGAPIKIEVRANGKETDVDVKEGDWIVTNMDRNKQLIRDQQGSVNTYAIDKDRFDDLYELNEGRTEYGQVYKAKGVVDAIELPGGFDIVAPWKERQQAASGFIVRNGDDVYGIQRDMFDQTYEFIAN